MVFAQFAIRLTGKEGVENKQEDSLSNSSLGTSDRIGDRENNHGDGHASCTKNHQLKRLSVKFIYRKFRSRFEMPTFRRPNFSIVKTATQEAMKYSVPLHAAMSLAKNALRPTSSCNTVGM